MPIAMLNKSKYVFLMNKAIKKILNFPYKIKSLPQMLYGYGSS